MPTFEDYYNQNPISVVDQNVWDDKVPQVIMNFQRGPTIYTPLIQWTDRSGQTGASTSEFTEILEGDVDFDDISLTAEYIIDPAGVDSRSRRLAVKRYGDKVMLHESSNIFQMWQMSGRRDWRPLLRGVLGNNVVRKLELLARNAYMLGPKDFWTYGGNATNFGGIDASCKFTLDVVNAWNLRLGNTGTPVIPGTAASVKVAIVPPGAIFDFQESLAASSSNEASMWRDAHLYSGQTLQYEIGSYKNTRFVEVPNDTYGQNLAVLYNAGNIIHQCGVKEAINQGDGAPDPEINKVDETWYVGQKDVTHWIQLEDDADMSQFEKNDMVSIHTSTTDAFGVTGGVNFLSGKTIVRRVVVVDPGGNRLQFDRPVMRPFKSASTLVPQSTASGTFYALVTKAIHIGFILVLGSAGGIMGNVNRPLKFYEPKPIDDFESVWRYVWDIYAGYNIWEPNLFECHFVAVTLPKPGGVISPPEGS